MLPRSVLSRSVQCSTPARATDGQQAAAEQERNQRHGDHLLNLAGAGEGQGVRRTGRPLAEDGGRLVVAVVLVALDLGAEVVVLGRDAFGRRAVLNRLVTLSRAAVLH